MGKLSTKRSETEAARVFIGTSGWHYASWRGPFFPPELMVKHQFEYYASQFSSVELNGVFYRTPTEESVESWCAQAPKHFIFAWKASKYITHWKRLTERSENSLELLKQRSDLLGDKLGPILFQLPPQFSANLTRLESFLPMLPKGRRYVFEFRHPSWYDKAVLDLLAQHDVALCISDHHDAPSPWEQTASFVYIRGHGPGGRYEGHYTPAALKTWAKKIAAWKKRGADVYVYFDNDQKSAAPFDAAKLQMLVS